MCFSEVNADDAERSRSCCKAAYPKKKTNKTLQTRHKKFLNTFQRTKPKGTYLSIRVLPSCLFQLSFKPLTFSFHDLKFGNGNFLLAAEEAYQF